MSFAPESFWILPAMTDANPPADPNTPQATPGGTGTETSGPGFRALGQYVKDLSFENPQAPESLRVDVKPKMDMGVELGAQGRPDGLFEVELRLSVKATTDTMKVFDVELVYAGLFQLWGINEQDIEPILMIECPATCSPSPVKS
jgi:protein translocase subunit secB